MTMPPLVDGFGRCLINFAIANQYTSKGTFGITR